MWCDVVQAWQGCECGVMWCRHGKGASVVGCGAGMARVRVWCDVVQAWQGCECGVMWCRHGKGVSVV